MKPLWILGYISGLTAMAASAWAQTEQTAAGLDSSVSTPLAKQSASIAEATKGESLASSGRSALENGLFSMAVEYFKDALSTPGLETATRDTLNMSLATAYLAQNQIEPAAAALQAVTATDNPTYLLRKALLASRTAKNSSDWDAVGALLNQVDLGKLNAGDVPWYYSTQAALAESHKDATGAALAWQNARDKATSPLQANQFQVSEARGQILMGQEPTKEVLDNLYQLQGSTTLDLASKAKFAADYTVMLDKSGKHDDAILLLKHWLVVTDLDRKNRDALRLELVLLDNEVAAPASPEPDPVQIQRMNDDRDQLKAILEDRVTEQDPDHDSIVQMQHTALALLENSIQQTHDIEGIKTIVDELITQSRSAPLLKQLYLLKAQLAFALKQYDVARAAAEQLLDPARFPREAGRDLGWEDAHRLLAFVAYNADPANPRYREAADHLQSVYNEMPAGPDRTALTGLLADMSFLNGDYTVAAKYYLGLLNDPPPSISRGELLVRVVESDLKAGQLDDALALLDKTVWTEPEEEAHWRAEWEVLTALRDKKNGAEDAFNRLNHLLDPQHANVLPLDFRLRLQWLNASLAVSIGHASAPDKASTLLKAVTGPNPPPIEPVLLKQLQANALLLSGEAAAQVADLTAKAADEAQKTLPLDKGKLKTLTDKEEAEQAKEHGFYGELRKNYFTTDAAIYSYFAEATEWDAQMKSGNALILMNELIDKLKAVVKSGEKPEQYNDKGAAYFLPFAEYQAALYSAEADKNGTYVDAFSRIDAFLQDHPDHPLVYEVRMEQAKLQQSLNSPKELAAARDIYDLLIKTYPNNPATPVAELSYADCLMALAGLPDAQPSARKDAIDELTSLVSQENLPVDARVEAGYKWGVMLATDNNPDPEAVQNAKTAAAKKFWDIYSDFLDNASMRPKLFASREGRYWMSKCLVELAKIDEDQNKPNDAQIIYNLIINSNLTADATKIAQARLKPGGVGAPPVETTPLPPVTTSAPVVVPAAASAPATSAPADATVP